MATHNITLPGNWASRYWTATLTPTGGPITISRGDDVLVLLGADAFSVVVVDGDKHTVVADGAPAYSLVAPGSNWPVFQPGSSNLTAVLGATGTLSVSPVYA
jgi:hypothetical protein